MGFSKASKDGAISTMRELDQLFLELDCTLVAEINPMGETPSGQSRTIFIHTSIQFNTFAFLRNIFKLLDSKTVE
jgi:succinyl-CoA synthetase beta subunit